jgi:ATP-dependent 26S proteasome regulatory subunit
VDLFPSDLSAPVAWVEALARREVARLRADHTLSPDELLGQVVGNAHVDALLSTTHAGPGSRLVDDEATRAGDEIARWLRQEPAWRRLRDCFGLEELELRALLLALAPELEARFVRVYAYLNDHAGRSRLTRDLALRLLPGLRREALAEGGTLLRSGLLTLQDVDAGGWPLQGLRADPAAAHVLQGLPAASSPVPGWGELLRQRDGARWPSAAAETLARLAPVLDEDGPHPWVAFYGRPGSGRTAAAVALAGRLGIPALRVDVEALAASGSLRALALFQALTGALVVADAGALIDVDGRPQRALLPALDQLAVQGGRIVWRCRSAQDAELIAAERHRLLTVDFEGWTAEDRALLWVEALAGRAGPPAGLDVDGLASRFRLTPGQIAGAAARADEAAMIGGRPLAPTDVFEAAREQSRTGVGRLAVRVDARASWDDVVLPDETLEELQSVVRSVRYRDVVFERWGFGRHTAGGRGIVALFSGPPGTGKTLSAEVVAVELELDLYRIELSAVVSKYIGETSSNLRRVFEAARDVDAMLLFDECDALFGKRSEVKDSHDRYANTDIAYLLQAVEAHASTGGPVILCTNRIGDLDGAFLRRIQHVVEFPLPKSVALRRALFERHLAPGVPLAPDLDLDFLAENFELAGGDVRNAVLDATLRAAGGGEPLAMQHLVQALARQLRKRGTTPTPSHFKQYYALLQRPRPGLVA